jgi:hypothetical protein
MTEKSVSLSTGLNLLHMLGLDSGSIKKKQFGEKIHKFLFFYFNSFLDIACLFAYISVHCALLQYAI